MGSSSGASTRFRGYVADYYCAEAGLIVELDGDSHEGREEYDARRTDALIQEGFRVVRFVNTDVFENLDGVLEAILSECESGRARSVGGA